MVSDFIDEVSGFVRNEYRDLLTVIANFSA